WVDPRRLVGGSLIIEVEQANQVRLFPGQLPEQVLANLVARARAAPDAELIHERFRVDVVWKPILPPVIAPQAIALASLESVERCPVRGGSREYPIDVELGTIPSDDCREVNPLVGVEKIPGNQSGSVVHTAWQRHFQLDVRRRLQP